MKRKLIVVILAFCMVISAVACGDRKALKKKDSEVSEKVAAGIESFFGKILETGNGSLGKISSIEKQLSQAYIKAWEGSLDDFKGVDDFEIENVDEKTHDQSFSCTFLDFAENGAKLSVKGLAKDEKVIQVQSVLIMNEADYEELSSEARGIMMALPMFPISIYQKNISNISAFSKFFTDMEEVYDSENVSSRIKTDGDIEYTSMLSTIDGAVVSVFTIRYMPAFSEGYFDELE